MTRRDRIQTTGIVILAVLSAALIVLARMAQIAHVQF